MACIGGISSGCNRDDISGKHRRVTCAPQVQPPQPQPQLNNVLNYYNSQVIQGSLYSQHKLNQIINSDNNYNDEQYNQNLITLNDMITNLNPDNRNLRNFEGTILPIIPVDYQRGRETINYELSQVEMQQINISYNDNPFYGLNYPHFSAVILSLNENRFNNLANN